MTYKAVGTDTSFYTYDLLGNLVSVLLPDDTFIEYIIDGQNRRVGKKVDGVFQKGWLYQDQLNPVVELDENGDPALGFVYGTKGHVPDFMVTPDSSYRFITDHLGSVRLVVNAETGIVRQRLEYDEFGNVIVDTNPGFQPFGYAGGLYDEQTGLVRFGARDYDAETGRWTAKDPIRFISGGSNLYQYVFNQPINLVDPLGLSSLLFDKGDNTLTLYDNEGRYLGQWSAANFTVLGGADPWPNGTYDFQWHSIKKWKKEGGPNEACDTSGNFIFNVEGRTGMGVHAGREDLGGHIAPTEGCIRTTSKAMKAITHQFYNNGDPLTHIVVQN